MHTDTVSFQQVKQAVPIQCLLEHYELLSGLTPKKDGFRGSCPFHRSNGSRSFHISTSKNAYYCFGCKRGGNILDFVAESESVALPEASRLIASWFNVGVAEPPETPSRPDPTVIDGGPDEEDTKGAINTPLSFELRNLDPAHASLEELGLSAETATHFGGGFCQTGLMKNRVAIPIHDRDSLLIGYAGYDTASGTYKHPPNLYPWMEIYNLHRQEPGSALVVVPDYLDVWRLHVAGVENVVALLGGRLGRHQEQLLEVFEPAQLLLLQTTARDLQSIGDRLMQRFYIKHQVVPADADLATFATAVA